MLLEVPPKRFTFERETLVTTAARTGKPKELKLKGQYNNSSHITERHQGQTRCQPFWPNVERHVMSLMPRPVRIHCDIRPSMGGGGGKGGPVVTYARSGSMSLAVIISSINRIRPSTYPCLGSFEKGGRAETRGGQKAGRRSNKLRAERTISKMENCQPRHPRYAHS